MARVWLAACTCLILACSRTETGMLPQEEEAGPGREQIPAEWTVAEDTAETGEVTTLSLQLPTARDIGGLLDEESPRLILRCVDGRVGAFIDTGLPAGETGAASTDLVLVSVQLDSAPPCE